VFLVKGHTSLDDLDEDAPAQSRMSISLDRAQAVADYLISRGVSPDTLRVQGCGTFEPVVQRAYRGDSHAQNRRVEVEASAMLVTQLQHQTAVE
jgi:outer membrane protein OmpA-like peptidoglycan-associated protein